jgi:transcriptional repressor NrdR
VVNSRTGSDGTTVKRRRECSACARRFTTYERVEDSILRVVKKDGGRENFSRAKILKGLTTALYKRSVPMETVEELVDQIEREVHHRYESEVPSSEIGELVMERLKELDQVAFIRFASVYREFKDVSDFVQEADTMLKESGVAGPPGAEGPALAEAGNTPPTGDSTEEQ